MPTSIYDVKMSEDEIAEEIEWYINERFGKQYDGIYVLRHRRTEEEEVVWFDHGVSEDLSYKVLQHLVDEEMNYPSGLDEIPAKQWKEWLDSYETPERGCSCDRGCRRCLGTEY